MNPHFQRSLIALCLTLVLLPLTARAEQLSGPSGTAVTEKAGKLPGTASVSQSSFLYGADSVNPRTFSETNDSLPQLTYKLRDAGEETYSPEVPKAAGHYTVKVFYPETETHLAAVSTADFTIRALVRAVSLEPLPQVPSRPYNGRTQPIPLGISNLPIRFELEGTDRLPRLGTDYFLEPELLSPFVDRDPDSKNLSLTLRFPEGLYAPDPGLEQVLFLHADILPAPLTLTALPQATKEGYLTGPDRVAAQGLADGDRLTAADLLLREDGTLLPRDPVILQGDRNVTDQYEITYFPGTLTHAAEITAMPTPAENLRYQGKDLPLLSAPGQAENGTLYYEVRYKSSQTGEPELLQDWSTALPQGRAPGIYTISVEARSRELSGSGVRSLTVILYPRVLQVSAQVRKVYDGTPAVPEEAIRLQIQEGGILPGDEVSVKTVTGSLFQQKNAGTDLKIIPGSAVLEGADGGNYTVKIRSFTGSIEKKPLYVTAEPAKKAYGQQDPVFFYRAEGLLPGDCLTGSLSRTAGEDAGSYLLNTGSLSNPNYQIHFTPAKLEISQADCDLQLTFSGSRARPGRVLTLTLQAENREKDLMKSGWSQPSSPVIRQGKALLTPAYEGGGSWKLRWKVPQDARGSLTFSAELKDPNYLPQEEGASVPVSFFGSNPKTGDRILIYGTLLFLTALLLLGSLTYYLLKKKH